LSQGVLDNNGLLAPTLGDRLQQDRTYAAIFAVAPSDDAAVVVQVLDVEFRYALEVSVEWDSSANGVPKIRFSSMRRETAS